MLYDRIVPSVAIEYAHIFHWVCTAQNCVFVWHISMLFALVHMYVFVCVCVCVCVCFKIVKLDSESTFRLETGDGKDRQTK